MPDIRRLKFESDRQDEFSSTSGAAVNPGQEVIMNNFSLLAKTRWQTRRRVCIYFFYILYFLIFLKGLQGMPGK